MKEYFAKNLSQEGEIKEGDKIRYESRKGINFDIATKDNIGIIKLIGSNIQKVKLFLCSRAIQVGDTVQTLKDEERGIVKMMDNEGNVYVELEGFDYAEHNNTYHHYYLKNIVKVIGEVSRYATWVTEGDEFDHKEVALNGIWQNWNEKTPLSGKNIVFVKGPCGHFH